VVQSFTVPYPGPSTGGGALIDVAVDQTGKIDLRNGIFIGYLSQLDPVSGTVVNTAGGFGTNNGLGLAGIGSFQSFAFIASFNTQPSGIVRIDLTNGDRQFFATGTEFSNLTVGGDGLVYALISPTGDAPTEIAVYDPLTMGAVRTVPLSFALQRAWVTDIAVTASGRIFASGFDGNVYEISSSGTVLNTGRVTSQKLWGIDVSSDGTVLIVGYGATGVEGALYLTDLSLSDVTSVAFHFSAFLGEAAFVPGKLAPAPRAAGLGAFSSKTGQWFFRGTGAGGLESSFDFGGEGFVPVYGDWNGDGVATIGAFDPVTATWYLRNEPGPGKADFIFPFGPRGSIPVVGDWDGNGTTTIGVFVPESAQWYLRNSNSSGAPDISFRYGWSGVVPVAGNWGGGNYDGVGVYDPPSGLWLLRNSAGAGPADHVFSFGYAGTHPVAGDWAGLGTDGIGVFDPSTGTWLLRNKLGGGAPDLVIASPSARGGVSLGVPASSPDLPVGAATTLPKGDQVALFGPGGQWTLQYGHTSISPFASFSYGVAGFVPLYGDWDGNGTATPGVFDPSTATFYLRNEPGPGKADLVFQFGPPGSIPVVGDWDGNGTTTIGVFVPQRAQWYLRNSNSSGAPDISFQYGWSGVVPVAGNWAGNHDGVGVYDPSSGLWVLRYSAGGGPPDQVFSYGYAGAQPVVGDWTHSGQDGVGIYDPSSGLFQLRNIPGPGSPDLRLTIGGGLRGGRAVVWTP
jgi:hypothetical protein